jgi:hypothetical protein
MSLTPRDIAELDQAHQAAARGLDQTIAEQRVQLLHRDPVVAAAVLHLRLLDECTVEMLASFAALAVTRLAQGATP